MRIGYLGWGNSPCNHRRFAKISHLAGLLAEPYNPDRFYDVVVVTQNSDLTAWSRIPRSGPKLIFDFVDSYLQVGRFDLRGALRGLAKFAGGQHRYLELNYRCSLERMLVRADAVVCSTPEQKDDCLKFNSNTHDILDLNSDQVRCCKSNYKITDTVHLAWEGMGANAWAFQEIAPVLKEIHARRRIALHLVTDLKYRSHGGPFAWHREAKPYLQNILSEIPVFLYEWNAQMLSTICINCDIAVLPIPREPPIYWAKPENRLLMLWQMGLPVIASATPAYARCMRAAGNQQVCLTQNDWKQQLESLLSSEAIRRESARRGLEYSKQNVSLETLSQKWFKVIESVL